LPSDATYDKTSGVSFVCDLNDNIAAPWPPKSYAPASTCNKSMAQMLNLLFSMESIFAYKVLLPLFTARTPTFFFIDFFLDFMELQLPNFHNSPQQHLHKVVRDLGLYCYIKTSQFSNLCSKTRPYTTQLTFNHSLN
jgi:hypothetical protein